MAEGARTWDRTFVFDRQETSKLGHSVLRDVQCCVGHMLQLVVEPQKRFKQRGSSGMWHADGLKVKEVNQYRKDVGLD